jgi:hypothetical protein
VIRIIVTDTMTPTRPIMASLDKRVVGGLVGAANTGAVIPGPRSTRRSSASGAILRQDRPVMSTSENKFAEEWKLNFYNMVVALMSRIWAKVLGFLTIHEGKSVRKCYELLMEDYMGIVETSATFY